MDITDVIAVLALVVSVAALVTSYKANQRTLDFNKSKDYREFEREKAEFIVRIEKALSKFKQLEITLAEVMKTDSLVEKFKSDLKYLEGCQRQAYSLRDETYEMGQNGFAFHKPRFLKLIEEDEEFARNVMRKLGRYERTKGLTALVS